MFADPSVEFGLQFTVAAGDGEQAGASRDEGTAAAASVAELPTIGAAVGTPPAPSEAAGSAEVVTLDRFRKK